MSLPRPLNKEEFLSAVERLEGTISAHSDADGISSAVLFNTLLSKQREVVFPEHFGDYTEETLCMLDMKPREGYRGYCIDHHPEHPSNREYTLLWDSVPTGLIIWNNYRERIPREKWWIVGCSCVGDGQPYLIPREVFREEPSLLDRTESLYPRESGVLESARIYDSPVWLQLSSPLNNLAKVGLAQTAYELLKNTSRPIDLITDPAVLDAKERVKEEKKNALRTGIYESIGEVIVGIVDSEVKIESEIARILESETKKTAIILNERRKAGSVRGVLSEELKALFRDGELLIVDGHSGYMGVEIVGNLDESIERIRKHFRGI